MVDDRTNEPHEDRSEADAPRRKRWTIARWVGGVLAGMVLLVAALLFGLNTAPGKRFIADQIAAFELENGLSFRVGRIEGSIYGEMVLHDVSVSDPEGVFLTSPELRVDWRPFAFLGSHVDIRSATAQLMTLQRLPELRETPPSNDPLLPDYDIDLDQLAIDRFVAEEAVSGARRAGTIAGEVHIADRRARVRLDAVLRGESGAEADRLALVMDAVPDEGELDLDLDLEAPEDGVLAALAGLSAPLQASLEGTGDWQAWNGQFDADLGGEELARLRVTARDGTFGLSGPTRAGRLFEGPTAALLGPVLEVDVSAALNERAAQIAGDFTSASATLEANGLVDLSDNSFEDFALDFVLLRPGALAENLSGSGLRAQATLNGEFATPEVAYNIDAARLAFAETGLEGLTASGAARVRADRILIPVTASARRITGLDTVAGGALRDVRLAGDLAIDGARVLSDNIRIVSNRLDAEVILVADVAEGLYTGAIDGRLDDYRLESVGTFTITTDVDLRARESGFDLAGRVRARSTSLSNEGLRDFLGGEVVAGSNIRYGSDGVARFSDLSVRSPGLTVSGGSGFYALDGRLAIEADGESEAYGPVGLRVTGSLEDPDAVLTAERPGLGVGLANLEARVTGEDGGYRLDAAGDTDYGPLTANVLLMRGETITLDIASANLAGIDFSGTLRQTEAGPFAGRLDASGQGVVGAVRLDAAGEYQQALVNLRAKDTRLPGPARLSIGSAIIDARIVLYDQPRVIADVQVSRTRLGALDLNAARAKIDYRDGSGSARVLAEGVSGVSFRVAANVDLAPELWRAAIKGRTRGIAFETRSPARIVPGEEGYELLPTRIDFGRGAVRLAGSYGEGLNIQSRFEELDMAIVNAFVPGLGIDGQASGSLDFVQSGPNAFPRADARLQIAGFSRSTAVSVSEPVDINFVGKLLPDGGEARAVMRRRGSVIGRMNASLRPLPPGEGGWTTRLLEAPLGGGVRYNGPAATLFSFAGQPNQRLTGPIAVAADFDGRVASPSLSGIVRGEKLTYVNQIYGTRLSDMALAGRFAGDRFELERLTATAGDGSVSANGFVSLAEAGGYPMNVEVTLDNARLARSEALSARASGTFTLTKESGETALLTGRLTLPEARYKLARQGAAEVPELTGVRFKEETGPQRITGDEPAVPTPGLFEKIRLDITMRAPERLYVSGMGLESEWSANLGITGTSADPRVSGEVTLVRGTLGFAGRSFALSDGRVGFTGGATINPTIALTATEDIEDVTVNVDVTGQAYNPQIAFSSSPGLPQDEIVSRILFGRSVGNLSTIQAVQLAASLNSLRGSGGGLNPLGKLRSATGVDRLRILGADETTGRGTALAAGQYLTDDIYIEFITDARGFTATQLEVSLTPTLSILSQAGGSGATDVEVRYRKNY
jgi:translocation and assembly module TamB